MRLLASAVPWDRVFPDALEHASGVRREELRDSAVAFVRVAARAGIDTWSKDELSEAAELMKKDNSLKKVLTRTEEVVEGMGSTVVGVFRLADEHDVPDVKRRAVSWLLEAFAPPPS